MWHLCPIARGQFTCLTQYSTVLIFFTQGSPPWIDPAHSQVTAMQAIQLLPKQLFSYWGQTARVFVQKSGPAIYASGVVLQKARNLLPGTTTEDSSFIGKSRRRLEEEYDLAVDVQMELEKYGFQMAFEESVEGANSEALICMKKCPEGAWGECEDYGRFVREFAGMQRQRIVQPPSHGQSQEGGWGKLKVEAYFATSDIMIGKKGQRYFEDCWRGKGLEEDFSDLWSFDSVTIEGANHETVCSAVEVLERVFQQVKLSCIEGAN
ncbi:hypothetical protein FQN50_006627 [Emmonsiellopsis sp. PD_5]|nr:hypothetical protein FQN50_006627 [Emmonsiellopsis sp. PD_5]